jgi:hypothetical protein
MYDEKAAEIGRPEEKRSKPTDEEDREGHLACEKESQPEFQGRGCGGEIPPKPGTVRREDRARLRPAPPRHRMGRSASAGLTPLRHSDAPSAHSQTQPIRRFAPEPGSHRLPRPRRRGGASGRSTVRSWVRIVLRNHRSFSSSRLRGEGEKGLSLRSMISSPDAASASGRPSRFPRPRSAV